MNHFNERRLGLSRGAAIVVAVILSTVTASTLINRESLLIADDQGQDENGIAQRDSVPRGDQYNEKDLRRQAAPKGPGPTEVADNPAEATGEEAKGAPTEPSSEAFSVESLAELPQARELPAAGIRPKGDDIIPLGLEFEDDARKPTQAPPGTRPKEISDAPQQEAKEKAPKDDRSAVSPLAANFEGVRSGSIPADAHLAVGPNHIAQAINSVLRITSKSGGNPITVTFANLFTNNPGSRTPFDPWIAFDHFNNRWILLATTFNSDRTQSWYMIAASKTADPTAGWWLYSWRADIDGQNDTSNWADYPKFGFDNTNIYISSNQFASAGGFQYAKLRGFAKGPLYAGQTISGFDWVDIRRADGSKAFTIQPCTTFGTPGKEYLVATSSGAGNNVTMWSLPTNLSSLSRVATVAIGSWSPPELAQQPGGVAPINTMDSRLLGAVFRSGLIYTCHCIKSTSFPSACRFIVIDTSNNSRVLDVAYGAAGSYYYYPAITVTTAGTIFAVFNHSNSSTFASIRYTSKKLSDARFQNSALLKSGETPYVQTDTSGRNRWGDYNGIAIDPSGGVWFNAMYARTPANSWGTWVGKAQ